MKQLTLNLVKKDTKQYTFKLTRNGVAEDISGWQLYYTVKVDFNDVDLSAKILKNVTFPNNAESQAGIGYLNLTSTETDIPVGEYFYDFKFIDTNYRETFLRGKLEVIPTIRTA